MFYSETLSRVLRFGDVVRGYLFSNPTLKQPLVYGTLEQNYYIDIEIPQYSVIVTPCCSIEEKMVSLTPLIKLKSSFFLNEYFIEDFTIINREIEPEKCFTIAKWNSYTADQQSAIISKAKKRPYTLGNLFIYENNDIFSGYTLRGQETKYYMIDFRNITTVRCEMIKRAEEITEREAPLIASKCLELTEETRKELRDKIAFYYGRIPEEDELAILNK